MNKIFKRLVVFILLICCLPICPAYAEESEDVKDVGFNQEVLDILELCNITVNGDKDGYITNREFALIIAQMMNIRDISNDSNSIIDYLTKTNIIPNDMNFLPETTITLENAYRICINTLGYNFNVQNFNYIKIVRDLDLDNNITKSGKLKKNDCMQLVYNTLLAPVLEISSITNNYANYVNGDSLISIYHDVIRIKGKILATEFVSLLGYEDKMQYNYIYVDGKNLCVGETDISNYCGYTAEIFARKIYDEYTVEKYYLSESSDAHYVRAKDVVSAKGFNTDDPHAYLKNPEVKYSLNNKTKTIRIDSNVRILDNGTITKDISNNTFFDEVASFRFIDSNSNGYCDVIYISRYNAGKVEEISIVNKTIKLDDGKEFSFVNTDNVEVHEGGRVKSFESIGVNDIVCIYAKDNVTLNGKIIIRIISRKETGKLSMIDHNERILSINDKEFYFNSQFKDKLKFGIEYDLFIDGEGTVVYALRSKIDTEYAYLLDYYIEGRRISNQNISVEVMCLGNEVKTYTLSKKIRYTGLDENDKWLDTVSVDLSKMSEIFEKHFNSHQLIRIKVNESEQIEKIMMAKDVSNDSSYDGVSDNEFLLEEIITPEESSKITSVKAGSLASAHPVHTLLILDNISDEEDIEFTRYAHGTYSLLSDESNFLDGAYMYDTDTLGRRSVIVVQYNPDQEGKILGNCEYFGSENFSAFVVDSVSTTYDADEDTTYLLKGYCEKRYLKFKGKNESVSQKFSTYFGERGKYKISDLVCGDVIIPVLNKNQEITDFYVIFKRDEDCFAKGGYVCNSPSRPMTMQHVYKLNTVYGQVRNNYDNMILTFENIIAPKKDETDVDRYLKFGHSGFIYIYDSSINKVILSDLSEPINDRLTSNADTMLMVRSENRTKLSVIYR